jgi:hypothetical protein
MCTLYSIICFKQIKPLESLFCRSDKFLALQILSNHIVSGFAMVHKNGAEWHLRTRRKVRVGPLLEDLHFLPLFLPSKVKDANVV